jgi:lipoyl(octanoyl) transferase
MSVELDVQWLGRRRYAEVWELQKQLLERRIAGEIGDTLLLLEHEPVYTWGKRTNPEHLGAGADALRASGADAFEVERGGEVTYHGPGQLTGYPICNLGGLSCGRDLHRYMRALEEMIIRVLAGYGLQGTREPGLTGVWVEPVVHADPERKAPGPRAKVAALGVRVRKWCSMHGFALNVSDAVLPWFARVTPCGIKGRSVTTLQSLLGREVAMEDVTSRVVTAFREVMLTPA